MSRFAWRRHIRSQCSAQRKRTGFAFTVSQLEERAMLSLVTAAVADINQLGGNPASLTEVNGKLFFLAQGRNASTASLWETTPTAHGVTELARLEEPNDGLPSYGPPFVSMGGDVYFMAADSSSSHGLWKSDGTTAGTTLVAPLSSADQNLAAAGGKIYFTENGPSGPELWTSDGTTAGTVPLTGFTSGDTVRSLMAAGGKIFFVSDNGTGGRQLWSSDGTATGTTEVTSLNGPLDQAAALGNELVFAQPDPTGSAGASLWASDGTSSGTVRIHDFPPSASSGIGYILSLTNSGGTLYFAALSGSDLQLWTTDGTVAGTRPLTTTNAGAGGVVPSDPGGHGWEAVLLGERRRERTASPVVERRDGGRDNRHRRPGRKRSLLLPRLGFLRQ
jgi:ELWxxDGT repeat protein